MTLSRRSSAEKAFREILGHYLTPEGEWITAAIPNDDLTLGAEHIFTKLQKTGNESTNRGDRELKRLGLRSRAQIELEGSQNLPNGASSKSILYYLVYGF